jgi:hypothetical protein
MLTAAALLVDGALAVGFAPRHLFVVGTAAAFGVTTTTELRGLRRTETLSLDRGDAADALAVVAGAGLTYWLGIDAGLGPVLASASVGLVAGVAFSRVDSAAYCGSFVGMVSPTVFPDLPLVLAAGAASAGLFVAARGTFDGFGGKLGTTALFGCLVAAGLSGTAFAVGSPPAWGEAVVVVPTAALAAAVTVALGVRLGFGAVVASALVGLFAGLALPALFPRLGDTIAPAAFCASFVGMVAPERIEGELRVGLTGGLSGLAFVALSPSLAGAGGKLGTTAFVSCLAAAGAAEAIGRFDW